MPVVSKIENEETFEYYSQLPPAVRMVLVNQTRVADRCRLSRCSKQCYNESKSSNSFISLKVDARSENLILISVQYLDIEQEVERTPCGFLLAFERKDGASCMTYSRLGGNEEELWRSQFPDLTDLIEVAIQEFKKILISNQNVVEELFIGGMGFGNRLQNVDFEIDSLRNVTRIRIVVDINISQFISRTRLPLDVLSYTGHHNVQNVQNFGMIYDVEERFEVFDLRLNKTQFFNLFAAYIDVHIGSLTAEDVFEYIQSWQNGQRDYFEFCRWTLEDSNFNVQAFFDLYQMDLNEEKEIQLFTVTHNITEKTATWFYDNIEENPSLVFEVDKDDVEE